MEAGDSVAAAASHRVSPSRWKELRDLPAFTEALRGEAGAMASQLTALGLEPIFLLFVRGSSQLSASCRGPGAPERGPGAPERGQGSRGSRRKRFINVAYLFNLYKLYYL